MNKVFTELSYNCIKLCLTENLIDSELKNIELEKKNLDKYDGLIYSTTDSTKVINDLNLELCAEIKYILYSQNQENLIGLTEMVYDVFRKNKITPEIKNIDLNSALIHVVVDEKDLVEIPLKIKVVDDEIKFIEKKPKKLKKNMLIF